MKKQWIWIIAAVAFVGLIIGAYFLMDYLGDDYDSGSGLVKVDDGQQKSTEDPGEADPERLAPDFTVYDANGKEVKLSDLRGKPVVFNMWASWCGPCKNEMPGFQEMYEKYGEDVHFLMINLTTQDSLEDAKALISQSGYTFPVYFDTDNTTAANYSTGSIPTTFFANSKGELVTYAIGAIDEATLEKGIGMIQE